MSTPTPIITPPKKPKRTTPTQKPADSDKSRKQK